MTAIPPPGPHGDDAVRVAASTGRSVEDVLDLATSLNPAAPDVRPILARCLDTVRSYGDATYATATLASALGVAPGRLLLTNGAAEAIALVAAELGAGEVVEPEFSLYRRHLAAVTPGAGRWRSNPNNPTGRLAPPGAEARVWDESFYGLATGEWTRGDAERGAVVLGSLTKLFACPGLRIGYVLSEDEALVERLALRQPRWSVGSLACEAVPLLLDLADLPGWARRVATLRQDLVGLLAGAGLEAGPSDANFVLIPEAAGVRDRLARRGVVVRDCSSFGLTDAVRVAVPSEEGLERLARALAGGEAREPRPARRGRRPDTGARPSGALLVCGTSSDAGKSQIVTGLCRLLARRGVRVAPFKAQNMSLNSFATSSGHEIGRAQGVQALAAGAEPEAAMNPVLLKPTGERRSQVIVMGRPTGELDAAEYLAARRAELAPVVLGAFAELRSRFEVVIAEGAGSAAEINLLESDLSNLWLAREAGMPAIVVGDIERGGVFASLYGTVRVVPAELAQSVRGFVVNKFRGDPALLAGGIEELERRTGVPVLGVLPYLHGLSLDSEDSLGLAAALAGPGHPQEAEAVSGDALDVAVVALPHVANFTDVDALAIEAQVSLRLVRSAAGLGDPDLVLIPGSKTTVRDLDWLRRTGLAAAVTEAARRPGGPVVLGICAGYQMLGRRIRDDGVESDAGEVAGLGLLAVETTFRAGKATRPRRGKALGAPVEGYEIRHGEPEPCPGGEPVTALAELADEFGAGPEGAVAGDGRVAGTSLHGLFESDPFRSAFLAEVAARRGRCFEASGASFAAAREAQFDRLADLVETHLDLERILELVGLGGGRA